MSFTSTTLHKIPVVEEKPSILKQSILSNTIIAKRWVTKTELVRVPVTYEEIYVNGKPLSRGGGILSELKNAYLERMKLQKNPKIWNRMGNLCQ